MMRERSKRGKIEEKGERVKKCQAKGLLPILVIALVLGIASSGFSQGDWVFGIKGDIDGSF